MKFTDALVACIAFQKDKNNTELEQLFKLEEIKNYQKYKDAIYYFFEKKQLTPDSFNYLLKTKVPEQVQQAYDYLLGEDITPNLDWLVHTNQPVRKAIFIHLFIAVNLERYLPNLNEFNFGLMNRPIDDYRDLLQLLQQQELTSFHTIKKALLHPNPRLLASMIEKSVKEDRNIDVFNLLINANPSELKAFACLNAQEYWTSYQAYLKLHPDEKETSLLDRAQAINILHQQGLAHYHNLNMLEAHVKIAHEHQVYEDNLYQSLAKTLVYCDLYPQLSIYRSVLLKCYPSNSLTEHLLDLIEEPYWVSQQELPELFYYWQVEQHKSLETYKYSQKYVDDCLEAYRLLRKNEDKLKVDTLDLVKMKHPLDFITACLELGSNLTQTLIDLLKICPSPVYGARIVNFYLEKKAHFESRFNQMLRERFDLERIYDFLLMLDRHNQLWLRNRLYRDNFGDIYFICKIIDQLGLPITDFLKKSKDCLYPEKKVVCALKRLNEKNYITEELVFYILNEPISSFLSELLALIPDNVSFIKTKEFISWIKSHNSQTFAHFINALAWLSPLDGIAPEFIEYVMKNPDLQIINMARRLPAEQLKKFHQDLLEQKSDAVERAGINYLTLKYCHQQITVSHRNLKSFYSAINLLEEHYQLDAQRFLLLTKIEKNHHTIAEFLLLNPKLILLQGHLISLSSRPNLPSLLDNAKKLHEFHLLQDDIFLKLIEEKYDYASLVTLCIYLAQCGYYMEYKTNIIAHESPRELVNILYKLPNLPSALFKTLLSDDNYYQALFQLTTLNNFRGAPDVLKLLYSLQEVENPQLYVHIFGILGVEQYLIWEKITHSPALCNFIYLMLQNNLTLESKFINFLLTATESVRTRFTEIFLAIHQLGIQLTNEQLKMIFYSSNPDFFLQICHLPRIINNPELYSFALKYLGEEFLLSLQRPDLTLAVIEYLMYRFPNDINKADFFHPALNILMGLNNKIPTIEEAILLSAHEHYEAIRALYTLINKYCSPEKITPYLWSQILKNTHHDSYLLSAEAETTFWLKISALSVEEFSRQFSELLNSSLNSSNESLSPFPEHSSINYSGAFFRRPESEEPPTKKIKNFGSFGNN